MVALWYNLTILHPYPVILSYQQDITSTKLVGTFLSTNGGRRLFRRHMRREFNVENFCFWEACQEFINSAKNLSSVRKFNYTAGHLYTMYLRAGSDMQVNVSGMAVRGVLGELKSIFDDFESLNFDAHSEVEGDSGHDDLDDTKHDSRDDTKEDPDDGYTKQFNEKVFDVAMNEFSDDGT
eukprot:TRINITY_DN6422_c0_g1_i1.p1 TRINITY_DN6422_c0_g1~~TRINITY_DN6422_c0_g1_i1.p1  ORF type:complete len:180 (-),score=19.95 TRINITY_DN6422_c0_g1_i1:221-760(-)